MLSLDLLILESISSTLLIWSDKSDRSCWIQFIIFDHRWLWFTSTLIGNFMRSSSWCLQCLFRILCVYLFFVLGVRSGLFVSWMYDPAHGSSLSGPLCTYLKSLLHLNWKAVAMCFKEKITFRSHRHWSLNAFYTLRLQLLDLLQCNLHGFNHKSLNWSFHTPHHASSRVLRCEHAILLTH